MSVRILPPPLFDLDAAEYVERAPKTRERAEETLPPPLFERRPGITITLTPFSEVLPLSLRPCSGCGRRLKNLSCTHSCGGARAGGSFDLCDDCAAQDVTPDGLPRWGLTPTSLAIERLRRRVYAAGGGETEMAKQLTESGLRERFDAERAEHARIRAARAAS